MHIGLPPFVGTMQFGSKINNKKCMLVSKVGVHFEQDSFCHTNRYEKIQLIPQNLTIGSFAEANVRLYEFKRAKKEYVLPFDSKNETKLLKVKSTSQRAQKSQNRTFCFEIQFGTFHALRNPCLESYGKIEIKYNQNRKKLL